jgi:hypothetical protein
MSSKRKQKRNQIQELRRETQEIWNMKCMIIHFIIVTGTIIGATGIITEVLKKKFEAIVRKTFSRFATKDKYAWNLTQH